MNKYIRFTEKTKAVVPVLAYRALGRSVGEQKSLMNVESDNHQTVCHRIVGSADTITKESL